MPLSPSSGVVDGKSCEDNPKVTTNTSSSSTIRIHKQQLTKANTLIIKTSSSSPLPSAPEKHHDNHQKQEFESFDQQSSLIFYNSQHSFEHLPQPKSASTTKSKFEVTPETIHRLNRHQSTARQRRPRVQWATRSTSLLEPQIESSPNFSYTTKNELNNNMPTIMDANRDENNIGITESSSKDFDNEYQRYVEKGFHHSVSHNDLRQSPKFGIGNSLMNSSDDDDEFRVSSQVHHLVDRASQAVLIEMKPKKIRSANHKKIRSAIKRAKQTSATPVLQLQQSPPLVSSSNKISSNGDPTITTTTTKPTSSSIAKVDENNTASKHMITVDTSKARSNLDVVRMCVRELGWKECSYGTILDSDIYWHSSTFHEGNTNFAFNSGRVNKFPGMNDILRKVHLTRSLNVMRALYPNEFDFYPKTWFLPEQSQQFKDDVRYIHEQDKKHSRAMTTFIVKPSDGSQGEGIYLIRNPNHCTVTNRPHVVQEYIDRPLLINGLKFDLRIYVLILNLYPLEILLYDEGLVRFATIDYKAPSTENLHQTFMHLTNYSLNKRSAGYKHTSDDKQTDGSKRKLSTVWTQLTSMYGPEKVERTKNLITEMINKTVLGILPELHVEYEYELPLAKKQNISCFQIVGFDIILTDHLKPILLEVNANPSLRVDFDKEDGTGKVMFQPSLIDEEIKKPLVLETLKLALPKKKLHTIARHTRLQVQDELMAQRVEKVAQRRVEERSEKIKSARKTRFDLRLNPFFSRPSDSVSKEWAREQQEQQQQKVLLNAFPHLASHPTSPGRSNENVSSSTPIAQVSSGIPNNSTSKSLKAPILKRSKSIHNSNDDDESGVPTSALIEDNPNPHTLYPAILANSKRPIFKSATTRHVTTTDAVTIGAIKNLKIIFPSIHKTKYRHMCLLDRVAYIYIQLVVMLGHKTMTSGQFRSFANICGIINDTISAPSIDILYYQMLRKWQQFVSRTSTLTGLPFAAFMEAFFLLSQRKFPSARSLLESVTQLVNICIRHLNVCLQAPASPLIQQSNQYLLQRAARNNNSANPSSMNNRASVLTLRSTTAVNRSVPIAAPSSPSTKVVHQIIPTATVVSTNEGESALGTARRSASKQLTKSVFPLFFDVL